MFKKRCLVSSVCKEKRQQLKQLKIELKIEKQKQNQKNQWKRGNDDEQAVK